MEVSVQGLNHPNQDAAGSRDQTFWVLDGATPLFPPVLGGGDVEGTVQRISQHLFLHADRICDLRILLEAAVKEVEQEYRQSLRDFDAIEKYRLPTFACALGRIEKNELSYLILADCEIRTSLGKRFTDPSFAMTSAANRENEKRILKKYGADSFETMAEPQRKEALEEFWEMNRKQRMALNTPGGYWVGSLDGTGIAHAFCGRVQLQEGEHVYAMSDGFAHLADADPVILTIISEEEMKKRINELRYITDDDVTMIRMR